MSQQDSREEAKQEEREDIPQSWAGYSWYLVKRAGHGAYSGVLPYVLACIVRSYRSLLSHASLHVLRLTWQWPTTWEENSLTSLALQPLTGSML